MGGLLLRLRTWWETADRTQKAVTLFGGVFLGILLLGTFFFASKPKLQPAFTGLSFQDMGRIEEEVKKMGIPYAMGQNGEFDLPSDKIAQVKAQLANAGKLPTSGAQTNSMGGDGSPFEPRDLQQERQRARLENEIAETIKYMEGVESARVKIAPGTDSPFADSKKPTTASVTLLEKAGSSMVGEPVRAVANLVAFSIPGLDVNHVTVVNQQGRLLWDGADSESAGGQAQKKIAAETAESKRRERDLQNMLDRVFGAGTTVATVSVTLDFDQVQQHESTTTASENPLSVENTTEKMDSSGKSTAALPPAGTTSNTPNNSSPTFGGGGGTNGSSYGNDQTKKTYPASTKDNIMVKSSGSVTSMSVTVLADSGKLKDQEDALKKTVEGFIGPKVADTVNYKSTVEMVKFDTTSVDAAKKAASASAMSDKIQQLLSILPIVALLIVGFIVVKAIGKAAKEQTVLVQALPDGRMMPIAGGPLSLSGSTSISPADESAVDGDSSSIPAMKKAKPEIGEIPDNVNVPLEQIKKMTNERPEAVAMLIKSWLLEDRR